MKAKWFPYNSTAEHSIVGKMRITHRSDHGHCRGICVATGQELEVCLENLTFPKPPSKASVRPTQATKRRTLADKLIEALGI